MLCFFADASPVVSCFFEDPVLFPRQSTRSQPTDQPRPGGAAAALLLAACYAARRAAAAAAPAGEHPSHRSSESHRRCPK